MRGQRAGAPRAPSVTFRRLGRFVGLFTWRLSLLGFVFWLRLNRSFSVCCLKSSIVLELIALPCSSGFPQLFAHLAQYFANPPFFEVYRRIVGLLLAADAV